MFCSRSNLTPHSTLHTPRELLTPQEYSPDNTVPVGLGVFGVGVAVGIDLLWHAAAVIHHDGQLVRAGGKKLREVEHLRRGDVVRAPCELCIDIDLRRLGTLKEEIDRLAFPVGRYLYAALVPGATLIGIDAGEMGGDITHHRTPITHHLKPITLLIRICRSRQLDSLSQDIVRVYKVLAV